MFRYFVVIALVISITANASGGEKTEAVEVQLLQAAKRKADKDYVISLRQAGIDYLEEILPLPDPSKAFEVEQYNIRKKSAYAKYKVVKSAAYQTYLKRLQEIKVVLDGQDGNPAN